MLFKKTRRLMKNLRNLLIVYTFCMHTFSRSLIKGSTDSTTSATSGQTDTISGQNGYYDWTNEYYEWVNKYYE